MKQFNRREKILGLAIFLLSFIFVFKALIFDPLYEKLTVAEQEIKQAQAAIRKYTEIDNRRDLILKDYKKIGPYLNLMGSEEEKIAALLRRVEAEARGADLTVVDMRPEGVSNITAQAGGEAKKEAAFIKRAQGAVVYRIQLNAEGDIAKIFDFIYRLENADILFKIAKISVSIKDENAKLLKLETSILGIAIS